MAPGAAVMRGNAAESRVLTFSGGLRRSAVPGVRHGRRNANRHEVAARVADLAERLIGGIRFGGKDGGRARFVAQLDGEHHFGNLLERLDARTWRLQSVAAPLERSVQRASQSSS